MKRITFLILAVWLCLSFPGNVGYTEEERVVLTIGDINNRAKYRCDGDDQLGVWQYLENLLGIEIQYVDLSEGRYEAAFASGNLPDIVTTNNDLSAIMKSGLAMDIDPYIEEYAPNLLKGSMCHAYDLFKRLQSDGKGFYFIPSRIGYNGIGFSNTFNTRGYNVRWDYYKELGCPPINNEDDYLDVLKRMQANHPVTEEGYPTYLYGSENFTGYETAFRTEYSMDYWAAYEYHNNIFTNEIYDGYVDPEHSIWWAAAAWYNKLYLAGRENGSFDMEMFTQTKEEFNLKRTRGQYMGLHNGNELMYNARVVDDPDTISGYCTVPTAATNYYSNVCQLMGNGSQYMWFISTDSPRWEIALKLFNIMCDPAFVRDCAVGQRGITWDYDALGEPQMTEYGKAQLDAWLTGDTSEENYFSRWGGYSKMPNNWPLLRSNVIHPDGYPIDFYTQTREYAASIMTNVARDMCEVYDVELPSDAFYKAGGLDFRNDCGEAISSCITSLDADQVRILSAADAILDSVQIELIFSESREAWDAIQLDTIQRIVNLGEPEVFSAYQEKWNAVAEIMVPHVREVQIANGIQPYTPEEYEKLPYKK